MSDWPAECHPLREDGSTDFDVTVELYPHMPTQAEALSAWCAEHGATTTELFLNGGPVLLLSGSRTVPQRLAGLGDIVVRPPTGSLFAFPGGELGGRYIRADHIYPPPVD